MTYTEHYPYFDPEPHLISPDLLGEALEVNGIAIVDLGPNLNAEALYGLAESVGRVMLEPTPSVREQAYREAVVRLETLGDSTDTSIVAVKHMGMHIDHATESPPDRQPLRILLGCITPPAPDSGGLTVACDMQAVFDKLHAGEQELLSQSHQRLLSGGEVESISEVPLINTFQGRRYVSLWDAGPYGEAWDLQLPPDAMPEQATAAVDHMRDIILSPEHTKAVPWQTGRVLALDNHRFLHGRTAQIRPSKRVLLRAKVTT